MPKISATDYLAKPEKIPVKTVVVLFGDAPFLKQQVFQSLRKKVLSEEDAEFSLTRFEGNQALFPKVMEELATMAMFGGETRLVVVDEADSFISKYRAELEDYMAAPSKTGILLLNAGSFPSNTRLYKLVDTSGLAIDCKALTEAALSKWLVGWAKSQHKMACEPAAIEMLVDLIGPELGLLDQELIKLSLLVVPGEKLTTEQVRQNVGSWRTRTAWEMLDLTLSGNVPEAIRQLDRLIQSGESAVGLLAMTASSLRRLAAATLLILNAEKQGHKIPVKTALEQAGVKPFVLAKSEQQLRILGRHRGQELLKWLIQADLDLKGNSRLDPRLILEQMIVRLASPRLKVP